MADEMLHLDRRLWVDGLAELHRRGGEVHEAGAFLVGPAEGTKRKASNWIFYDDLDPHAYSSGVCILDADAFDQLWQLCRDRRVAVLADVHTHPGSPRQSPSDRTNPMVAVAGHLAIIVPNYAVGPHWRHQLGVYRYEGSHQWTNYSGWRARRVLRTGTFR